MVGDGPVGQDDSPHHFRQHHLPTQVIALPDNPGELEVVDGAGAFFFGQSNQLRRGLGIEAEMAARGGVGVELDTSKVPTREPGMTPYEILLSESQERMLVVAEPANLDAIQRILTRWELTGAVVGRVTGDGIFRVVHDGVTVAAIPGADLVDRCPIYHPEARESDQARSRRLRVPEAAPPAVEQALEVLLDSPTIASKRWVFEQFDSTIQANTVSGPGSDAGVLAIPGSRGGLAVTVDCNARYVLLDPFEGGKAAVAEAARNIACKGATPLGITDCLNFGNPEKPEIFFQFQQACRGISAACSALGTPVTGGNVSFYNESPNGAIDPSPVIGMVGLLTDIATALNGYFQVPGDEVAIIGDSRGHLGGSAYWAQVLGEVCGSPPPVNLTEEVALQRFLTTAIERRLLRSAHDLSDGGLAVAVAESCMGGPYAERVYGADLDLSQSAAGLDTVGMLFGEDHGRAVVSYDPTHNTALKNLAAECGIAFATAGKVTENPELRIAISSDSHQWHVASLRTRYLMVIPNRMARVATSGGS